jgi:ATP-dependent DNA helicase RecQ
VVVRQLIHQGYLNQDIAEYNVLKLTPKARPLLRGDSCIHLAKPRPGATAGARRKSRPRDDSGPYDQPLFERLRALRKQLADEQNVPPYIVFGDSTLIQMARHKPRDSESLLAVNGVGQHKLANYGAAFLRAISEYCENGGGTAPAEEAVSEDLS